jgi:hypothetical protein
MVNISPAVGLLLSPFRIAKVIARAGGRFDKCVSVVRDIVTSVPDLRETIA